MGTRREMNVNNSMYSCFGMLNTNLPEKVIGDFHEYLGKINELEKKLILKKIIEYNSQQ